MPKVSCSEQTFIEIFTQEGAQGLIRAGYYQSERAIYKRRARLERRLGRRIPVPGDIIKTSDNPERHEISLKDGIILVGSDAHYWPNRVSTAHKAFVEFVKELRPKVIILNGDLLDGARISRHPPVNWDRRPLLKDELKAVEERLDEIRAVSGNAILIWILGNHDWRFESYLANNAPEFEGVPGSSLKDHFPHWIPCMSCWINDEIVIKHRFKSGVHATHNNTLWSGKTFVTGHLHSQKVTPFTDYNGTRWGVDSGTLAEPLDPAFMYTEDNPKNWRSGFAVLTIKSGSLLQPELVRVLSEGRVDFRGEEHDV